MLFCNEHFCTPSAHYKLKLHNTKFVWVSSIFFEKKIN